MVDEKTIEHSDDEFSTIGDDNVQSDRRKFKDANKREFFMKWLKEKGPAGLWAFNHNIGLYAYRDKNYDKNIPNTKEFNHKIAAKGRARYIGAESWYDEDHFFWIKLDDYERPLLSQLRVSNHRTQHNQWQISHSLDDEVQCDTCLNLMIGKDLSRENTRPATTDHAIISVECVYDESKKTKEQKAHVEKFISDVTSGKQPTITFDEIREWIDPNAFVVKTGGENVRDNQFQPRENLATKKNRIWLPKWADEDDDNKNKQQGYPKEILFDDMEFTDDTVNSKKGDVLYVSYCNGLKVAYNEDDFVAYPFKTNGNVSWANPIPVVDELSTVEKVSETRIIRMTEGDLYGIIKESVKRALKETIIRGAVNETLRRFIKNNIY